MPGVSGVPVVTTVCTLLSHTGRGCHEHPAFPAPSLEGRPRALLGVAPRPHLRVAPAPSDFNGRMFLQQLGRMMSRDRKCMSRRINTNAVIPGSRFARSGMTIESECPSRDREERSDEAIQSLAVALDCFAGVRNDGAHVPSPANSNRNNSQSSCSCKRVAIADLIRA